MFINCETTKTDSSRLTEMLSALNRISNPVLSSATGIRTLSKVYKRIGLDVYLFNRKDGFSE